MKKKVIKDYRNLPPELREEIRELYPYGFINHMITFIDKDKHLISALPLETEEISYLIKMPSSFLYDEKDDPDDDSFPIESLVEETRLDDLGDEKFLIPDEDEESD